MEQRYYEIEELEIRAEEEKPKIRGYAAKFEKLSQDLGGFKEKIQRGAFTKSIRDSVVKALWNHNSDFVLGSTRNGSLKLWEDEVGLRFELETPVTTWGKDAMESIKRGDVDGVSFGFSINKDGEKWEEDDKKSIIRTLTDVRLFEISPTPFPAYLQTNVAVRSAEDILRGYKSQTEAQGSQDEDYIYATNVKLKLIEME
jgi:HK97 family phage prohead protease